ncbi:kinase-like domain-containing protein [Xylaria scruposa]|nr:kinase-like domain-containing protein [Xylaria scruposa]
MDLIRSFLLCLKQIWPRTNGKATTTTDVFRRISSSPTMMRDTKLRLYEAMLSSINGQDFVPLDQLNEIFTEEEVRSILHSVGLNGQSSSGLLRYIMDHAKKMFATVVFMDQPLLIQDLAFANLTDAHLPVGQDLWGEDGESGDSYEVGAIRSYHSMSDKLNRESNLAVFRSWPPRTRYEFCDRQWLFLAPVFSENNYKTYVHRKCPLPFLPPPEDPHEIKSSHHSKVYKVSVHPAHLKLSRGDQPNIAIKELYPDTNDEYDAEAKTLAKLNHLSHPHLIKCIATFQHDRKHCFMFLWAGGGNLRQFWAGENDLPRNLDLVLWVLQQMRGLASGLVSLHNFSNRENCRHGDLKPENILRFMDEHPFGRLVVTDLGSATFHDTGTAQRHVGTGAGYGTRRYEPPEAALSKRKPRSRRHDVWSIGCIFLEFLIWLLYKQSELARFIDGVDTYWVTSYGGSPEVHPEVRGWIRRMLRDSRCQDRGALGDLLRAVKDRMLVPKHDNANDDTGSANSHASQTSSVDAPVFSTGSENEICRADSIELDEILSQIVHEAECDPLYAFPQPNWEFSPVGTPSTSLLIPRRLNEGLEYSITLQ